MIMLEEYEVRSTVISELRVGRIGRSIADNNSIPLQTVYEEGVRCSLRCHHTGEEKAKIAQGSYKFRYRAQNKEDHQ